MNESLFLTKLNNYLACFIVVFELYGCAFATASEVPADHKLKFKTLSEHRPFAVRLYSDRGKLADEQIIPVTISLNLNHPEQLDSELAKLYDPGSPNFHHFMSSDEFRARFSPTEEQLAQVQSYLLSEGVEPTYVSKNRLLIRATGSVRSLSKLFQTEIHSFYSARNQSYFAPALPIQVPSSLSIQAIHGLQNATHFHRHAVRLSKARSVPKGATGPNGGLSPDDIRQAYQIPSSLDGSGQTLALFELDGYVSSDITQFENEFNLPNVPLKNILIGTADGSTGSGEGEVTLDIELMIALAPGASKILVYEGTNDEQGMLGTYSQIADDNLAKEVSTSWGASEDEATSSMANSENTIFKQMAAQGQSIYAAAGDSGAYDNGTDQLMVDDPGSQPYIVGVGGTQLQTYSDGSYATETTWNNYPAGGGGGISTLWPIPAWQKGLANSNNLASSTMRNVPDVSLNADPSTGYSIYTSGSWAIYGGTSCAAPLWAAFTALVNQQREMNGLAPLGFANPAFYAIGRGANYESDFHNISDGSTNLYYPAVPGYNDATGWGSFKGGALLQGLSQDLPGKLGTL